MKKIYSLLLIISVSFSVSAQVTLEWQKCLGGSLQERSKVIIEADNGDLFLGGETWSDDGDVSGNYGGGNSDGWVVRLNPDGIILWQTCVGGPGGEDVRGIVATEDGGCIITGVSSSWEGEIPNNHGSIDAYVAKIDAEGNLEWANSYGGSNNDGGQKIIKTVEGGYLIIGNSISNDGDVSGNNGGNDIWLFKINETGSLEWQKCLGGSGFEFGSNVMEETDGYILIGETTSNDGDVSGNHGGFESWVVKIDITGNIIWQKCYGGTDTDYGSTINPTPEGGYIISCSASSKDGDVIGNIAEEFCYWLVNLNSNGNINWQKCYSGNIDEDNYELFPTIDGGYLLTGEAQSDDGSVSGHHGLTDFWQVKVDADGILEWEHCLGGSNDDHPRSIIQSEDGSIYTLGYTLSNDGDVSGNHGYYDIWLTKESLETSIHKEFKAEITLSPNPAADFINLDLAEMNEGFIKVLIHDQFGKRVKSIDRLSIKSSQINISDLNRGIYFINLFDEITGESWVRKFIKE